MRLAFQVPGDLRHNYWALAEPKGSFSEPQARSFPFSPFFNCRLRVLAKGLVRLFWPLVLFTLVSLPLIKNYGSPGPNLNFHRQLGQRYMDMRCSEV